MTEELKCQDGKYGYKYLGDLDEICSKYCEGSTENGEPIFASGDFPFRCRNCEHRDFDFCMFYKDLICFNKQSPFNCQADLNSDTIHGLELAEKQREATRNAFLKRNLPLKEGW
jgi:hypothetical protein